MKKIVLTLITTALLAACTNSKNEDGAPDTERDSLIAVISEKDSAIAGYLISFSQIENTLDSINQRQKNILSQTSGNPELKTSAVEKINAEITGINSLLENNRKRIASLNKMLGHSTEQNKQLEEAVNTLNSQLASKQKELTSLNDQLTGMSSRVWQLEVSVDLLTLQNAIQTGLLAGEINDRNRAYYITGTTAELEKENIIDKKGGLLGIGKSTVLSDLANTEKFTEIDLTRTLSIPLDCKNIRIITTHPEESYELKKDKDKVSSLLITDNQKFWSLSKYLVIVKK